MVKPINSPYMSEVVIWSASSLRGRDVDDIRIIALSEQADHRDRPACSKEDIHTGPFTTEDGQEACLPVRWTLYTHQIHTLI